MKTYTIPEQVANHLRNEMARGRWLNEMPGRDALAKKLGVSPRSVQSALDILEKEGSLVPQGQGRSCLINLKKNRKRTQAIRIAVLYYSSLDLSLEYELRHELERLGYTVTFPSKGLHELGMKTTRIKKIVRNVDADMWIVYAASKEVLQWFLDNKIKVFAIAGRHVGLPIAATGPDKATAYKQTTRMLIQKGHHRIVLACARHLRIPDPSKPTARFLEALREAGIPGGEFNLPDWDETPEGFQRLLHSLFSATPPTALILDQPVLFHSTYYFLGQRNIKVPQDVSLVCTDPDPNFTWYRPSVAHLDWKLGPVVRRIVKWVDHVTSGIDDRRQSYSKVRYVPGETVRALK
ncbi:hypothetical protein DDZ13_07750 [Coraliomargarita sinensis]|uniref:Transcriptional regulator LacI/GalR-like sensor domain-containing protein n=1 Tax=Coraliomargarita sinensis TaxID=2174842 RepID=A0A317ZFW4_9BACT|nr:substrate-binding domain-containing protein [Coraliomargarita sinensis]PXA04416.1 hypothetical protein DDZ13_07750 [Coraliomargarita sinensis]